MPPAETLLFFTAPEAAFVTAATDVLLPADDAGPGGVEAGVVRYIDRQLAGAFGGGTRTYRLGPWRDGTAAQGDQLPLTPAEAYRVAIADIEAMCGDCYGGPFATLAPAQKREILGGLDSGDIGLARVPGTVFMDMLLANAREGYFADPAYGGNQGAAAWTMVGYPGARGDYARDILAFRDKPFPVEPVTLADLQ